MAQFSFLAHLISFPPSTRTGTDLGYFPTGPRAGHHVFAAAKDEARVAAETRLGAQNQAWDAEAVLCKTQAETVVKLSKLQPAPSSTTSKPLSKTSAAIPKRNSKVVSSGTTKGSALLNIAVARQRVDAQGTVKTTVKTNKQPTQTSKTATKEVERTSQPAVQNKTQAKAIVSKMLPQTATSKHLSETSAAISKRNLKKRAEVRAAAAASKKSLCLFDGAVKPVQKLSARLPHKCPQTFVCKPKPPTKPSQNSGSAELKALPGSAEATADATAEVVGGVRANAVSDADTHVEVDATAEADACDAAAVQGVAAVSLVAATAALCPASVVAGASVGAVAGAVADAGACAGSGAADAAGAGEGAGAGAGAGVGAVAVSGVGAGGVVPAGDVACAVDGAGADADAAKVSAAAVSVSAVGTLLRAAAPEWSPPADGGVALRGAPPAIGGGRCVCCDP